MSKSKLAPSAILRPNVSQVEVLAYLQRCVDLPKCLLVSARVSYGVLTSASSYRQTRHTLGPPATCALQ